jgi:hypothetical protein
MSISLTCGPSGAVITGETEEELVSNVQAHARAHEDTRTPNCPASASSPRSAVGTPSGPSTRRPGPP